MGFDTKQVLIMEDGALVEMSAKRDLVNPRKKLPLQALVVDGKGIGVMNGYMMKDRLRIGNEGCLIVTFPQGKKGKYCV